MDDPQPRERVAGAGELGRREVRRRHPVGCGTDERQRSGVGRIGHGGHASVRPALAVRTAATSDPSRAGSADPCAERRGRVGRQQPHLAALVSFSHAAEQEHLDAKPAMRRGGKFTTATTSRPTRSAGSG